MSSQTAAFIQATSLLAAILKKDEALVQDFLAAGISPNCRFDGIPLLTIAAAQDAPLAIVRALVENGADPLLPIFAIVRQTGLPAHALARDPEVKAYLEKAYQQAVRWEFDMNISNSVKPENYTLNQFGFRYETVKLKEPEFYLDRNYTSTPALDSDNIMPVIIEPDRRICLIENLREVCETPATPCPELQKLVNSLHYN